MAAGNTRPFGPVDNRGYYNAWLKTNELFDKVFLSCINLDPFTGECTDELLPTMAYLAWYGRHLVVSPGKPVSRVNVLVGMWGDLMGPYLSNQKILDQDLARPIFVTAVRALMGVAVLQNIGDTSRQTYDDAHNDNTPAQWDGFLAGENGNAHNTPEMAMRILRHLAVRAGMAFRIGGVNVNVNVYVAVLKRGTMTESFTDKISQGMMTDLQIANVKVDTDACRGFFSLFGEYINDETIADISRHWNDILPVPATRLKLTVSQAVGSGLTALSVTGRAIRIYTDFDWTRIRQLYNDEWANYTLAVIEVGNNTWYGFKKSLGPVISTKYKNLSYV